MSNDNEPTIRASQVITPFGVGAIVELGGQSFTCKDVSHWPSGHCTRLADNNLERMLGKEIRRPPLDGVASVPYSRFPRWVFCPICRVLRNYTFAEDQSNSFETPTCPTPSCRHTELVPMRFVAVCDRGHMQDIDWYFWAHMRTQAARQGQCTRQAAVLRFETSGASGGDFNAMMIECSCGASNTFEGLTDRPYFGKCWGRQPWQSANAADDCKAQPHVHPRGASNVYYASSLSALDIASDVVAQSRGQEEALIVWLDGNANFKSLVQASKFVPEWRKNAPTLFDAVVNEGSRQFTLDREVVRELVHDHASGNNAVTQAPAPAHQPTQYGILASEWPYLERTRGLSSRSLRTKVVKAEADWPAPFNKLLEQITLIERLREVRALLGFRRLKPDADAALVPVDLNTGKEWLPGVEMFGEGIFLKFRESAIGAWEAKAVPVTLRRSNELKAKCAKWGREPAAEHASPRFIAIHTFAHGLVRRLAFDAGYSSSSLRERIYSGAGAHKMAGILIYTSDGDSEGSLGGLVRQGHPERLMRTLQRTLEDLGWCSGDPVCSELDRQGIEALNSAACHACCLISETSCTYNNSLLDRRLLIGSKSAGILGLMEQA